MNVYFVNPTYVKPEGWKPLLDYLKVKAAYSFIPQDELPTSLYSIIRPYLKASYSNQDMKKFSDNCVYWLRAHFEKHIRLITSDFEDVNSISKEERQKYSSQSALNNIRFLDEDNCLILLKLESSYNEEGIIKEPKFCVSGLQDSNLPTHITRYCLNILHKKYGHNQYQNQSSFIVFNEFFTSVYRFVPRYQEWNRYMLTTANGRSVGFMVNVNRGIKDLAPNDFPLVEVEGKQRFSLLRTDEGDEKLRKLIKEAEEAEKRYQEENSWRDSGDSWQDEVDEMNRTFWRECGEGGSNCESWPGWD
ncbi:MAG: hypothetical protein IJQ60_15515 [Prevotella sp.]|nr:hypothetical protein [Prevotella sp.]